jgi:hypothetical protein
MSGVVRIVHQPRKYASNPILIADRPWEKRDEIRANGTILHDIGAGRYRMYYDGGHLLAYSDDGIRWSKPSLGLVEFEGSKDNNIVFDYDSPRDMGSFVFDPREPDSNRRWKAAGFYYDRPPHPQWSRRAGAYGSKAGLYAFFSADGIHWNPHAILLIPGRQGKLAGSTWPLSGVDDVTTVTWDDRLGKFVAWLKIWDMTGGRLYRARAMAMSDDFLHWSEPWVSLLPDRLDPPDLQLYGMTGWPYQGMWLGMLRTLHSATANQPVDLQLVASHDGLHWARAGNRGAFIPNGPDGSYDHGYHNDFTNPPLRFGDELYFYYASTAFGKDAAPTDLPTGICLAKLRVDGFASLRVSAHGDGPHTVVTRPLDFTGRRLCVNAEASKGPIQVEILAGDPEGDLQTIAGFAAQDSLPLTGDGIRQIVTWKTRSDLAALAGRRIRLKFYLNRMAALYSFSIQ